MSSPKMIRSLAMVIPGFAVLFQPFEVRSGGCCMPVHEQYQRERPEDIELPGQEHRYGNPTINER